MEQTKKEGPKKRLATTWTPNLERVRCVDKLSRDKMTHVGR